jgi:hypothetical protein
MGIIMYVRLGTTWGLIAFASIAQAQPLSSQGERQLLPTHDNVAIEQQTSGNDLPNTEWLRRHPRTSILEDHLLLRGHVGIAGPAGSLGIDVDMIAVDWFALEAGIGVSPNGRQWALTPRFRYPVQAKRMFLGVGASWGKYSSDGAGGLLAVLDQGEHYYAPRRWSGARWYNFELNLDRYTNEGRGAMHMAWGIGSMQNPADYTCTPSVSGDTTSPCDPNPPNKVVTMYVVFGYGFSI